MMLSLLEPKQDQLGRDLTVIHWSAYDLPTRTSESGTPRVLVGLLSSHGRLPWVSEPLYSFDALSATGKTFEGRIYRLEGLPGFNGAAMHAWTEWMRQYRVRDPLDVSESLLQSILDANRMADGANLHQLRMKGRW